MWAVVSSRCAARSAASAIAADVVVPANAGGYCAGGVQWLTARRENSYKKPWRPLSTTGPVKSQTRWRDEDYRLSDDDLSRAAALTAPAIDGEATESALNNMVTDLERSLLKVDKRISRQVALKEAFEANSRIAGSVREAERRLRDTNLMATEILAQKSDLPPSFAIRGLETATLSHSTTSMLFYMSHLGQLQTHELSSTLAAVRKWIEADDFRGVHGKRQRSELLLLLTGYPAGYPMDDTQRQRPCLVELISEPGHIAVREDLLFSIRELGGSQAISSLWHSHLQGWREETESTRPHPSQEQDKARGLADVVIEQLCEAVPSDPKLAWEVASPLLDLEDGLTRRSWALLLAHPEFLEEHGGLRSHLGDTLKHVMEDWARQIEQDLGVKWDAAKQEHMPVNEEAANILAGGDRLLAQTPSSHTDPDFKAALQADTELEAAQVNEGDHRQRLRRTQDLEHRRKLREEDERRVEDDIWHV